MRPTPLTRFVRRVVTDAMKRAGIRRAPSHDESHWIAVVESLGEGVIVLGASGQIQTANAQAIRILGLTAEEMSSRESTDPRWRAIDEHYRPFPRESHPSVVALRTGAPVIDCTMGVRLPAGDRRWIEVSAFPLATGPHVAPHGVVVSLRDVTDRRAAIRQARFHASCSTPPGRPSSPPT